MVARLAKALGASADEVLGRQKSHAEAPSRDRRFIHRLQQIDRLPDRSKQALLKTIDTFLKGAGAAD